MAGFGSIVDAHGSGGVHPAIFARAPALLRGAVDPTASVFSSLHNAVSDHLGRDHGIGHRSRLCHSALWNKEIWWYKIRHVGLCNRLDSWTLVSTFRFDFWTFCGCVHRRACRQCPSQPCIQGRRGFLHWLFIGNIVEIDRVFRDGMAFGTGFPAKLTTKMRWSIHYCEILVLFEE